MSKLAIGLGTVVLVVSSGVAFRLATGQCPVGCLMKHLHGEQAQQAPASSGTTAAN
jgi:hypothetical protein